MQPMNIFFCKRNERKSKTTHSQQTYSSILHVFYKHSIDCVIVALFLLYRIPSGYLFFRLEINPPNGERDMNAKNNYLSG